MMYNSYLTVEADLEIYFSSVSRPDPFREAELFEAELI